MPDTPSIQIPDGTPCNGEQIRYYRRQRGWTQLELATSVGVSERVIRKAEKGGGLRRETLEMLASALATPAEPLTAADLTTDPLAVTQTFLRIYQRYGADAPRRGQHLLHPEIVTAVYAEGAVCAGTFVGIEGFEKMLRAALDAFEVTDQELGRWYTAGTRVATTRPIRVRPRGAGLEAEFTTWVWNEYEVASGRIVRVDSFADPLAAKRQDSFCPATTER